MVSDEGIALKQTEIKNGFMYIKGDNKLGKALQFHNNITALAEKSFRSTFYDDFLGPGKIVFDLGAYIGDTTKFFLDKGSTVFAFEPNPIAFKCLQYNCPNSINFNHAISISGHKLSFGFCDGGLKNPAGQMLKIGDGDMEVRSLDEFIGINRCDLLKIDVQGFEPYVIDSGEEFLLKHKPLIFIEIWKEGLNFFGFDEDVIERKLTNLGYRRRVRMRYDSVFEMR